MTFRFACTALATISVIWCGTVAGADTTKKFTISGGQVIELPISEGGALPAEAGGVRVEVAGPIFGPSKLSPGKVALIWAFTLSVPSDAKYSLLTVENVTEPEAKLVATQESPGVTGVKAPDGKKLYILQVRGLPIDISRETTPWVYQGGITSMIFRVTLKAASKRDITLHQLTMFDEDAKAQIQQMTLKPSAKK